MSDTVFGTSQQQQQPASSLQQIARRMRRYAQMHRADVPNQGHGWFPPQSRGALRIVCWSPEPGAWRFSVARQTAPPAIAELETFVRFFGLPVCCLEPVRREEVQVQARGHTWHVVRFAWTDEEERADIAQPPAPRERRVRLEQQKRRP